MKIERQIAPFSTVYRFFQISSLLVFTAVSAMTVMADETAPDPEVWYSESYGVLWESEPWNSKQEIMDCYADEIRDHEASGEVSVYATEPWLSGLLKEWRAEGWVSSELSGITTDRLHPGMAAIKAQWRDFYTDQSEGYSCGWYLAKYSNKRWQMTDYATIDCAQHGF